MDSLLKSLKRRRPRSTILAALESSWRQETATPGRRGTFSRSAAVQLRDAVLAGHARELDQRVVLGHPQIKRAVVVAVGLGPDGTVADVHARAGLFARSKSPRVLHRTSHVVECRPEAREDADRVVRTVRLADFARRAEQFGEPRRLLALAARVELEEEDLRRAVATLASSPGARTCAGRVSRPVPGRGSADRGRGRQRERVAHERFDGAFLAAHGRHYRAVGVAPVPVGATTRLRRMSES